MRSVPHITNAIQDWIERVAKMPVDESGAEPDVCIIELGEYRLVKRWWLLADTEKVVPSEISRVLHSFMLSASFRDGLAKATMHRFTSHMFRWYRKFMSSQKGRPGTNNRLDQDLVVSKRRSRHRGLLAMSEVPASTQIWYTILSTSEKDSN